MKRWTIGGFIAALLLGVLSIAGAETLSVEAITEKAIATASQRLKLTDQMERACLTNALSASWQGKSTRIACDVIAKNFGVSLGKGNLLPVHERTGEPLWFAFISKPTPKTLMMVWAVADHNSIDTGKAVNVHVDQGISFDRFKAAFGDKAFALVTLANGWADGIPEDLMTGSLYHDHLCCGVCSGYVTVKYIREHYPLESGERYIYVGAPAWCQDDYIMGAMNLTPGKHGYVTMAYPWSRAWKTDDAVYSNLGGILIRFNQKEGKGRAHLLSFDWHEKAFKAYLKMPDMTLNWKADPWLHVLYTRFLMEKTKGPNDFVSTLKTLELKSKEELNRLIGMGANPLSAMLGPDMTWNKEITQ